MQTQNNIPALRFPEFDGEWDIDKLQSRIKTIDSGWSPQCEEFPSLENEWGVLKTTSVVWEGFNESANKKLPEKLSPRPELQVSINDILITRAGPTSRVGVVVHVNKVRDKLMLSDKLIRIRSNEKCSSLFLAISLSNRNVQKQLVSKSSGLAESQTNISQKILLNTKFFTPTLPEQQKIASFLSAVDEKIQQLTRKAALLEQYKKGIMQQLFSGTLRFKDDDGKDFPEWEEKKLGEVANFFKGKGLHKSDIIKNGKYKCLHYGELFTKYKESISNIISSTDVFEKPFLSIVNDVLMPTSDVTPNGLATASCINENDVILGGDVLVIRQKIKFLEGIFFSYYISQNRNKVMKLVSGSTVYHLYGSDMKNLQIEIPSLKEQQKIASFLSGIDGKIGSVNGQLEKTQRFKKGLLQQLFV
jgi:type I restriction enzyme, S subunit